MSENEQKNTEEKPEDGGKVSFVDMYIAIGCMAVGAVLFILSLTAAPKIGGSAGVYFLVSSMICELASVSFLNAQKRKAKTKAGFILALVSYAVMLAALAVFIVGVGVGSANK